MIKKLVVAFFITTSLWFLFTYKLTDVPPGINGDEAVIGYNAALISRTGKDARGNFLPFFSSIKDSLDWKQPITIYATAIAFKLFGPSYFTLRAVSVIFALLSASLIFLLIDQIRGFKLALVGLFIFATTPIIMIQSHLALENIAPIPFISLWLLMLYQYFKKQNLRYMIVAAVSLGFALYSYLGLRLIIIPLIILSLAFLYFIDRRRAWFTFVISVSPFIILLFLVKSQYPGAILGLFRPHSIASYQELIMPYISSFDPSFLFITGDVTPYHSTGKHGVFLLATLPLFILGVIKIIQKRNPFLTFVLTAFFIIPLFFGLGSNIHRGSRLLSLVPLFEIVATIGFEYILALKNIFTKILLTAFIALLILLNFGDFLNDYWYYYPQRVKQEFAVPVHKAFESLEKLSKENNLKPLIQNDLPLQNPNAFSFFEQSYFPNKLERWMKNDLFPEGSVIFVDSTGMALIKTSKIRMEKIEGTDYALVVNK